MSLIQQITLPLIGVNDTVVTVIELPFQHGEAVKKGDTVVVVETSKTTFNIDSDVDGYLQYLCELNLDYEVNTVLALIYSEPNDIMIKPTGQAEFKTTQDKKANRDLPLLYEFDGEPVFSKRAMERVEAEGMNIAVFKGRDFVNLQDVESIHSKEEPIHPEILAGKSVTVGRNKYLSDLQTRAIITKLSSTKKMEIAALTALRASDLKSTIHTYVDAEGIFIHLNRSLQYLKDALLPVVIYESARLLKSFPLLNAFYIDEAIAQYQDVNIGFAIDLEKGLKVLKLASADQKNIQEIEQEILALSGNYLDDNLAVTDLADSTFTITDLSSEGVAFFDPLINRNTSSILGISAIDEKLQRFVLSLAFDHRVTEGRTAAKFLKQLKERLESYRAPDFSVVPASLTCFKCFKKLSEDLSDTGFVKCITPRGHEGYICQSCLKGF